MPDLQLWSALNELKTNAYRWVDLTHLLSSETPHWYGFSAMRTNTLFDFSDAPMKTIEYTLPGQYGTHADVPGHFVPGGRLMHEIDVQEMVYPLCVIDATAACAENPDYALSLCAIQAWEAQYGKIPAGAFVAFRSDWHKRTGDAFENRDSYGDAHYPGWDLATLKWLVQERNIGAIGHESPDTDPAARQSETGFAAEIYILSQNRIQVELLCHLDEVPPSGALIVCAFPKLLGGTGFPARCFAICPQSAGA